MTTRYSEILAEETYTPRVRRRSRRRELYCPAHESQSVQGNGKKYFIHLLSSEELRQRGYSDKKSKLIINAYPVLVLTNEWLESLFCCKCGSARWCHVTKHPNNRHEVKWASRELWMQVSHVHPTESNPSVSQYSRREARRLQANRIDGKKFFDR